MPLIALAAPTIFGVRATPFEAGWTLTGAELSSPMHWKNAPWTPREFLVRRRTGARFAALPAAVQEEALQKLTAWAQNTFGSLDTISTEEHSFELDIFHHSK